MNVEFGIIDESCSPVTSGSYYHYPRGVVFPVSFGQQSSNSLRGLAPRTQRQRTLDTSVAAAAMTFSRDWNAVLPF
jgi:hypothetical protein